MLSRDNLPRTVYVSRSYNANPWDAQVIPMIFDDAHVASQTVTTYKECYDKNLEPKFTNDTANTDPNMAATMEKVTQFFDKGGYEFL